MMKLNPNETPRLFIGRIRLIIVLAGLVVLVVATDHAALQLVAVAVLELVVVAAVVLGVPVVALAAAQATTSVPDGTTGAQSIGMYTWVNVSH